MSRDLLKRRRKRKRANAGSIDPAEGDLRRRRLGKSAPARPPPKGGTLARQPDPLKGPSWRRATYTAGLASGSRRGNLGTEAAFPSPSRSRLPASERGPRREDLGARRATQEKPGPVHRRELLRRPGDRGLRPSRAGRERAPVEARAFS